MARIAGVNLPQHKRMEVALTYIHGIGRSLSNKILKQADVDRELSSDDLTTAQENKLREIIEKDFKVEGDLRRETQMHIKRLIEIGSYRGIRHRRNLPVRGQRTRTNARTRKGPKKTVAGRGRRRGVAKK